MKTSNPPGIQDIEITFDEKVRFLQQAINYPDHPSKVKSIETHFSWVFLTDYYAYKLKKPIHGGQLDLRTIEKRKINCESEGLLNTRLAQGIYLGVVSLTLDKNKNLMFEGEGEPVDWMVKMKRLPEKALLDYQITNEKIDFNALKIAALLLRDFYYHTPAATYDYKSFLSTLEDSLFNYHKELASFHFKVNKTLLKAIKKRQFEFVFSHYNLFQNRIEQGKIIDAHGDLRPEHICLTDPPVIIDCLDFDPDLRIQDPLEDLAMLAIEVDKWQLPKIGEIFYDTYFENSAEVEANEKLVYFYKSFKAVIKALLSIRHTNDPQYSDDMKWVIKTNDYLKYAKNYLDLITS